MTGSCAAGSKPTRPTEIWVADLTEHRAAEGKVYSRVHEQLPDQLSPW
jgi:hypothetical protein